MKQNINNKLIKENILIEKLPDIYKKNIYE